MNGADELALEPLDVRNNLGDRAALDFGIGEIRVLGGRVVAPNAQIGDFRLMDAGLLGELAFGAVLIEAGHGEEAVVRHALGIAHGDKGIGIARVADDEDSHVFGSVAGDGLALAGEDFAIDAEQIAAFHPGFAWHGSHEQCPIGAAETLIQIGSGHHFIEEREGAVIEFHDHSTQSGQCWLNFDEAEVDGLIRAEDGTGGDTEQQRVANLTSSTSDRNGNGILHK